MAAAAAHGERGVGDHHAVVQHRLQPHHADARPAARLPDDGRQPGADRPVGDGARRCSRTTASRRSACTSRVSTTVAGFERLAARARELRKPIVAMKVGRSEQARAATRLAHRLARRLGRGVGRFPEAARHRARRHDPVLPGDAEAAARVRPAGRQHAVVDELLGRRGLGDGRQRRRGGAFRSRGSRTSIGRACRRRSGRWSRSPIRSTTTPTSGATSRR